SFDSSGRASPGFNWFSPARLTIRFTVLRANPIDRAIARIFSPPSHRRITYSMSMVFTSLYAMRPPRNCLAYLLGNHNGRWVNDPENGGSKFLKTGGSMILKIYRPKWINVCEKSHHARSGTSSALPLDKELEELPREDNGSSRSAPCLTVTRIFSMLRRTSR